MVFAGLVIAWRFATWPTSRSPLLVKATTDGVVRPPSSLAITLGSPPSITATTELVVPRSMPIIFAIVLVLLKKCDPWLGWHLRELLSIYLMQGPAFTIQIGKLFKIGHLRAWSAEIQRLDCILGLEYRIQNAGRYLRA